MYTLTSEQKINLTLKATLSKDKIIIKALSIIKKCSASCVYAIYNETINEMCVSWFDVETCSPYVLHIPNKSSEGDSILIYSFCLLCHEAQDVIKYKNYEIMQFELLSMFEIPFFSDLKENVKIFNPKGKKNFLVKFIQPDFVNHSDEHHVSFQYKRNKISSKNEMETSWYFSKVQIHSFKTNHIDAFKEAVKQLELESDLEKEKNRIVRCKETLKKEIELLEIEQHQMYKSLLQNKTSIKDKKNKFVEFDNKLMTDFV
jgi:hypothetical protein